MMERKKRQKRNPDVPIHFEWQQFGNYKIVALDARLSDFKGVAYLDNGVPMMRFPEKTVKDCRNIDGCIYYCLGRADDSYMIDLIEKFQILIKDKRGWKPQQGIIIDGK